MIIGIAGKIASGKSTLARAVASRLDARRLGFGDYVRSIARSRGLDASDRSVLQELGHELATNNPSAFLESILSSNGYVASESIVFDGVRHLAIWSEIEALAQRVHDRAFLVYLSMPERLRQDRLAARGLDRAAAYTFDKHRSEADLESHLSRSAALTLNPELDQARLVETIAQYAEAL